MPQSPRQPTKQSRIAILIVVLLVCLAVSYWVYFAEILPTRRSAARSARVRSSVQKHKKLRAALIESDEEEQGSTRKHKAHHKAHHTSSAGPGNTWTGLSGYWDSVDVIEAADLSRREFERKYMEGGRPVVIRNDPGARALTDAYSLDALLELCGKAKPHLGFRVVDVLRALPEEVKQEMSRRLQETHQITLDDAIAVLSDDGPVDTLEKFFESDYFKTVETAQDPRFPKAKKDWYHVADYLWPPSIHSWPIASKCPKLYDFVQNILREIPIPFVEAIWAPSKTVTTRSKSEDFYLFASGDQCRAYHPHRHGSPNHVILLLLQGQKRLVTWPHSEADKLYPTMQEGMPSNEIKEVTKIFMANGFNVDLTRQPELAEVTGGSEGIAGPGDLLFIPCGMIHSLASTGDMVSVGWIPTKVDGSRIHKLGDCPNPNGKGYNWPPNAPHHDRTDSAYEAFDDPREKDPDPDNADEDDADNGDDDDNGNENADENGNENADDDGNGDDDDGDNGDDANSDDDAGNDNANDANSDNEDDAKKSDVNDNHKERARQLEEKNEFLG